MSLAIISANQRLAEKGGVKMLIAGRYGVGKTSLLRTLDPSSVLFIDGERGDLAVQDVPADAMRPDTWPELKHLAAFIGGPNPAFPAEASYSQAHYEAAVEMLGDPSALVKYETIFADSITKISRLALQWATQQPDAFNRDGKPDLRSAYGILGREMVGWITQLQHAPRNVIFTCAMEEAKDDFGRKSWELHLEGAATGKALPGIVDEVISYAILSDGEGGTYRAFVTQMDNEWGFPAKDRSGRLDALEPPDLGALIAKASDEKRRKAAMETTMKRKAPIEKAA